MEAILVRISVDQSYGGWNAPADPDTREFVYVPIPERIGTKFHPGCERNYQELIPALEHFSRNAGVDFFEDLRCPTELLNRSIHLDPDFDSLTYGDVGSRRGSHIRELKENDLLVFYAGLRPCRPCDQKLIYALIGLYVIDEVVDAYTIPQARWSENAHTRKLKRGQSDIVVRAKPGVSGRFMQYLPIGGYRDRAYRVRSDLLHQWGGLSVNDGYIQRSARPPRFLDPDRFWRWLDKHQVDLVASNNPKTEPDRIIIVHLRQPRRSDLTEMRSDPFWEFGSFGCTGCHNRNLMNSHRINEMDGVRLAFAQGGPLGFRLVMLTSPVRVIRHANRCELRWEPREMPFRYEGAPLLIDNDGNSEIVGLRCMIRSASRSTWMGRFSSSFRSRRTPLRTDVAASLTSLYQQKRRTAPTSQIASSYVQALPYAPNVIDTDRPRTYKRILKNAAGRRCSNRCK